MTYSYFPGCTLKTKAKQLDLYGRSAAEALGVRLEELEDWQCCGAVYPLAKDEIATKLSSVRALCAARDKGQPLVTLCSACHHVIKLVNDDMKNSADIRLRVNNYLSLDEPYSGETEVIHYLEMLRDKIGFDKIKSLVKNPLTGMKIAPYYGCMLLRPSSRMQFDDPENPSIMEDFIRAIGAQPVDYAFKNECCAGYMTLNNAALSEQASGRVISSARLAGAQQIITACPLCYYNLKKNGGGELEVTFFTELLAQALGVK